MINLYRGFTAGMLMVGLVALCGMPADLAAQAKKDTKKDVKKGKGDDPKDHSVGIGTSDGLTLNGYFYQGVGFAKQRPDAVIMMPAPGNKINESWINLAESLSKKNFSVLLFDWRGCGLNGPEGMGAVRGSSGIRKNSGMNHITASCFATARQSSKTRVSTGRDF